MFGIAADQEFVDALAIHIDNLEAESPVGEALPFLWDMTKVMQDESADRLIAVRLQFLIGKMQTDLLGGLVEIELGIDEPASILAGDDLRVMLSDATLGQPTDNSLHDVLQGCLLYTSPSPRD